MVGSVVTIDTEREVWVGTYRIVDDQVAVAWVRYSDEWLIDAELADTQRASTELARMARNAIARRGHPPGELRVAEPATRDSLRAELGDDIPIEAGFDQRAKELADAAVHAIEVTFGAQAMLARDARAGQTELMHARMHEAVENQLVADDPPQARLALERLQREGLDRGAAVHAIAGVFMHLMHQVLVTGKPFESAAYAAALDDLSKATSRA